MIKLIAKIVFTLIGWKAYSNIDSNKVNQAVIVAAPHTSNWDFMFTIFGTRIMNLPVKFMIKDSYYFFPLNIIMNSLGGVPVDRSKKNSLVDQVVEKVNQSKIKYIIISPEGTRSKTKKWHSGFYHIAQNANIPLYRGFVDYKRKVVGIDHHIETSGNFEVDLPHIKKMFDGITPKHSHKF